jgi:hypothetical protein
LQDNSGVNTLEGGKPREVDGKMAKNERGSFYANKLIKIKDPSFF